VCDRQADECRQADHHRQRGAADAADPFLGTKRTDCYPAAACRDGAEPEHPGVLRWNRDGDGAGQLALRQSGNPVRPGRSEPGVRLDAGQHSTAAGPQVESRLPPGPRVLPAPERPGLRVPLRLPLQVSGRAPPPAQRQPSSRPLSWSSSSVVVGARSPAFP
jgi:hypothetical protein